MIVPSMLGILAHILVSPPENITPPTITGSGDVGDDLNVSDGTWTPFDTISYQWQRNGVDIVGATFIVYTAQVADVGLPVRCVVTATNAGGSTSANSNAITVAAAAPVNTVAPVVTGTGYIGYTLTTTDGTWDNSPTSYTYQWQRAEVNIGGATASTYVCVNADEGVNVRCVVTAINGSGSAAANSNNIKQWVPTDLGADLHNWWDADDAATITIATGVSQWDDKGTLADDVTQGTAASQPAYSTTSWEGTRPGISFDGSNDWLFLSASKDRARNVGGYRMCSAFKTDVVATAETRICVIDGPSSARLFHDIEGSAGMDRQSGARRIDGSSRIRATPAEFADDLEGNIVMDLFLFTTSEAQQRINGTASSIVSTSYGSGNTSDTASPAIAIGALSSGAGDVDGTIYNLIIVTGIGTTAENEKIEGFLAWRARLTAKLPGGHTYKTSAPT